MSPQVPDALLRAVPVGLISNSSQIRAAATAVMRREPSKAKPILEAARLWTLPTTQTKRLDQALALLEPTPAKAPVTDDLLGRLIAAWARSFDERLIVPIAAAGAAQSAKRGPLRAASKGELEKAWLALAAKKDPGDVDRLLGTPWPGAWKLALARVEALKSFPPDPRIAAAVKEHAARYTSWRGRAVMEAAESVVSQMHQLKMRDAPAALLDEAAKLPTHTVDLEALWKGFWEDPRDEGRRAVLADALQSTGDPRGEFIALQVAIDEGRADASAEKRAKALLDQHIDSWSGGLPAVERASREFRRGFLVAVSFKPDSEHLPQSLERNEWRTIERLNINYLGIHAAHVGALMKRMPCLRAMLFNQELSKSDTVRFGGTFPTVKLISATNWMRMKPLEVFPALELVCTYAKDPLAELQAAKRSGLKGVMLRSDLDITKALREFEKPSVRELSELRLAPWMYSDFQPRSWAIRITREEEAQAELFHSGRYEKGSFANLVGILAAQGRTSFHVHRPLSLKARLEAEPHGKSTLSFSHRPFDLFR